MFGEPRYDIGNLVQLERGGRVYAVVWRGQQKIGSRGAVTRQWVYRLDNEHWDCYHEEELCSVGRWHDREF